MAKGVKAGRPETLLTHDGRTQTVGEWAREVGLTKVALWQRLWSGVPPAEALKPGPRPKGHPKFLEWQGKRQTVEAWAAEMGLKYPTLANRLQRCWTVEQALTTPASRRNGARTRRKSLAAQGKAPAQATAIDNYACSCADCTRKRGTPRTKDEREARWRREVEGRRKASRARWL